MKHRILLLLVIILFPFWAGGQRPRLDFDHISLREGLSQSSVTDILRDDEGFLWFATIDGLNRYNGYEIKIYYNQPGAHSLPGNIINALHNLQTPQGGQLWIGTENNGLCRYNPVQDNFIPLSGDSQALPSPTVQVLHGKYPFLWIGTDKGLARLDVRNMHIKTPQDSLSGIRNNSFTALAPTANGHLWAGTENGLYFIDTADCAQAHAAIPPPLARAHITAIQTVNLFDLWVGTKQGLWLFSTQTGILKKINTSNSNIQDNHITGLLLDFKGQLWATTRDGGLYHYQPQHDTCYTYIHEPANNNTISTNNLLSLYQDETNILWVGASLGGVNKWNRGGNDIEVYRHNPYRENSLSASRVRSIYQDSQDTIWIGTVDGGLNKWLGEEGFAHYKHQAGDPQSLSYNHVRAIWEGSNGKLWIGTDGGGLNRLDPETGRFRHYRHQPHSPNSLSHDRVWCIHEDSDSYLWIGTYGGGLNLLDRETGRFTHYRHNPDDPHSLSSDLVIALYEDNFGRLWIATGNGLNWLQKETGRFFHYKHQPGDSTSISHNRIYSLLEDEEGQLWIGTKGGLNLFDRQAETFTHFTSQTHDFPNNVIMGLLEDDSQNLWVSTNRGLSRFNKNTEAIRNFDIRDKLQSNEFLVGAYHKTRDGKMLFGGINGFNAFNPEKIKNNPNIPKVALTGFDISNRSAQLDTAINKKHIIRLRHNQNDLTFHFVALDYVFPEKNQYAYRLLGYDEEWVQAGFSRKARYTNLQPDRYVFQVIGSNNDGIWNKTGRKIVVDIQPAFWQTTWFQTGGVLLVLFLVSLVIYLRFRIIQKQNQLLEERVQERTAEVIKQKDEIQKKNKDLRQKQEEIITQNEILQQQKEEIETQRDDIEKQKDLVAQQHKEITASIKYAKKIQTAALPQEDLMERILPRHFVFFLPRDIVSGDFFWAARKNGKTIIVAADCTGHGVPGAFMSMLGVSLLNEIVNVQEVTAPSEILNQLRRNVIEALHQTGEYESSRDGMDMSVCTLDTQKQELLAAAANNPLYLVRDGQLVSYPADPMPIGMHDLMEPFQQHTIDYKTGDMVYMFSDGFPDQFGGQAGKKFKYKRFRKLFTQLAEKPVREQRNILDRTMQEWMSHPSPFDEKGFEQVDDMVIFGIRME